MLMNDTPEATTVEDEDVDLQSLSDDELVEQMHDDLYDGLKENSIYSTRQSYH